MCVIQLTIRTYPRWDNISFYLTMSSEGGDEQNNHSNTSSSGSLIKSSEGSEAEGKKSEDGGSNSEKISMNKVRYQLVCRVERPH